MGLNHQGKFRPHLQVIALLGVIVPKRLRTDWRREWQGELEHRELLLAEWDRLRFRQRCNLLWRSLWAFWDAIWLQSQRWEDDVVQDLRYAFRMLLKYPAFTLVAVLTVALAIGANTAAFCLINAVLLRPLPAAKDPQQLVMIQRGGGQSSPLSYPDYKILRDQNSSLNGLTLSTNSPMSFGNGSRSEVVLGALTTANYFDVLGVQPVLGRTFAPEEEVTPGGAAVAIVSYDFWQSRLNSDRSSVGKPIVLNGHQFTVIGVAPRDFAGTSIPVKICLWVPLMMYNEALRGGLAVRGEPLNDRDFERFDAIGRLKKNISLPQAEADLRLIGQQLERDHSLPNGRVVTQQERSLRLIQPRGVFLSGLKESSKVTSKLLLATVITLLLIACANVGNLLLARSTTRRREIAVRMALGATRTRILRQLLMESLVLSLLGAAAGLLVAYWFLRLLSALKPPFPPPFSFAIDLSLDLQSLGFAFSLALMSGLFFGLLPALQSSNPRLIPALKDETGNGEMHFRWLNLRAILVMAQVAFSIVLLIGAGLFLRSVNYAQQLDLGFRPEKVLAASFNLRLQGYDESSGRRFYEQLLRNVKSWPEVEAASVANFLPLGFAGRAVNVTTTEAASEQNGFSAGYFAVGENYFDTLGTPLLRGRDFNEHDTVKTSPVVIISEQLSRDLWPNIKDVGDVVGRQLRLTPDNKSYEIIGVARDSRNSIFRPLDGPPQSTVYRNFNQDYSALASIVLRTNANPSSFIPLVRREVAALDANLPVQDLEPLTENVSLALWSNRTGAAVLGVFSLLGLALAAVGMYGVMSYSVAQRTKEVGVRMALGADASDVLRLVVWQGARLALLGSAIGLALALMVTRVLASLLYGVGPADPLTFLSVTGFLITVALLACYFPARRATRVDPLTALRHD